jgi:hypothetical protein
MADVALEGSGATVATASAVVTAGTLWTPSLLREKVTHWYDAKDASTFTLTGSTVNQWRDKSGNGRHLNSNIFPPDSPSYTTTTFNGQPGVDYSNYKWQDTYPTGTGSSGEYNLTFFMAHSWGTTGVAYGRMWTHGASASGDAFSYLRGPNATDGYLSLEGSVEQSFYEGWTTSPKISSGGKFGNLPSDYKLWHDGSLLTKSSQAADNVQSTSPTSLKINANGDYQQRNDQRIGEMVFCFGYALTDAERQTVEGYLAHRWALAGSLPSNHPYKLAAPTFVSLAGSAQVAATAVASEAGVSVHWRSAGAFFGSDLGGTVSLPSGLQQDDVLLLLVETANQTVDVTAPAGWGVVPGSPQGAGTGGGTAATRISVFWKRYAAGDANPTLSDSGNHQSAQILAFRGTASSGDPWDATAYGAAGASTAITIPGLTTTVPDTLIVDIVAHGIDTAASNQVSGFDNPSVVGLQKIADNSSTAGNGGGLAVAISRKLTPGAVSATTAVLASSFQQGLFKIALKAQASNAQPLQGDLSVVASTTAAAAVGKPLAGSADSVATSAAAVGVTKGLSGSAGVVAAASASLARGALLAGSGAVLATTSGAATVGKPLAGSALSDVQPMTAALSLGKPLAGSGAALATASADLQATGSLAASALVVASTTGSLSKGATLAGSALSDVQPAAATATVTKPLTAAALSESAAGATLAKGATLAGSALGLSSASASFAGDASLAAAAAALASASAGLSKGATLAAGASGLVSTTGQISRGATLAGDLAVAAAAAAAVSKAAPLAGAALSVASAGATLLGDASLAGGAASIASATGGLSKAAPVAGSAASLASLSAGMTLGKGLLAPALTLASASASLSSLALGPTGRIYMGVRAVTLAMEVTAETVARSGIRRINQAA